MNCNLQSVCDQMEKVKEKLYQSCRSANSYSDPAIVKISQELDELITLYQRQLKPTYK
ncbi:aspartyl-phosphate phosphatase Spo0E family protein [Fictibacillus sp. WQ 8-8]|uniref:aspartyl-phosphate phosphatase Spo0E family protein n=1 Tax=unclassified Fictibacillus TaxID=2644029 RepID=UPI0009E8E96B|nr:MULTISPECIES: aspartyl-phosphate phosphatase Spo0E family protein [unclassified Fictibacillus]MCQ6268022.1 aspartyl-phosphate phosphatase Spo0E family protein [Fictibacillus sp. WQ 8-8]MED2971255.1 aspartyl-phosphate phosphatase Spo0E family protein [Fictibacillus sp. B-59209]UZJ80070.1 aspartyl-phosphate phosphatase Spo0E family protein [Fictibacillus sp. KU28468]